MSERDVIYRVGNIRRNALPNLTVFDQGGSAALRRTGTARGGLRPWGPTLRGGPERTFQVEIEGRHLDLPG